MGLRRGSREQGGAASTEEGVVHIWCRGGRRIQEALVEDVLGLVLAQAWRGCGGGARMATKSGAENGAVPQHRYMNGATQTSDAEEVTVELIRLQR